MATDAPLTSNIRTVTIPTSRLRELIGPQLQGATIVSAFVDGERVLVTLVSDDKAERACEAFRVCLLTADEAWRLAWDGNTA